MEKIAVVFDQDAPPELLDVLSLLIKTSNGKRYVLADEFIAGFPFCTLSLKGEGIQLTADVQSQHIALAVSSAQLKRFGFLA